MRSSLACAFLVIKIPFIQQKYLPSSLHNFRVFFLNAGFVSSGQFTFAKGTWSWRTKRLASEWCRSLLD